jgi:hypothetical protein
MAASEAPVRRLAELNRYKYTSNDRPSRRQPVRRAACPMRAIQPTANPPLIDCHER